MKKFFAVFALLLTIPSTTKTISIDARDAQIFFTIALIAVVTYVTLTQKKTSKPSGEVTQNNEEDDEKETTSEYFERKREEREERRERRKKERRRKVLEQKQKEEASAKEDNVDVDTEETTDETPVVDESKDYSREIPEIGEGFIDPAIL
jgi:DNA replication protein DnaC